MQPRGDHRANYSFALYQKKKKKKGRACSSTQAVGYQKAQKNKRSPFTTLPMHQISLSNSIDQININIYIYIYKIMHFFFYSLMMTAI